METHGKARFERLDMTTAGCNAAFPGLTKEIEDAVARGPFVLKRQPGHATGIVQGRIEDGKVGSERAEGYEIGIFDANSLWGVALCDFGG